MPLEIDWKAQKLNKNEDFKAFSEHLSEVHFDWKIKQSEGLNRQINAYIKKYSFGECFVTDVMTLPIKGERALPHGTTKQPCYLIISYILDGKGYSISVDECHDFVKRGNLFIWNSNHPLQFESKENIRQISVFIPATYHSVAQSLIRQDQIVVIDDHDVLSNILRSTLLTLRKNAHKVRTSEERPIINVLLDLAKACTESRSATQLVKNKNPQTLLQEAQEYIEENLFDVDIGVQSISRALGISNRYLHKLFASTEMSLTKTISDKRTALAARYLSDTGLSDLSVTDIAFMIGFNDSAYFSRVFKAKYGLSPKQFRRHKFK